MHVVVWASLFLTASALRCFEGTVGLHSNERTKEKECGISEYCIQTTNKKKGTIQRACSSFSDDHNMEERCPMTGCHWQSSDVTFCCCQFDRCNEWKADGSELAESEVQQPKKFEATQPTVQAKTTPSVFARRPVAVTTTPRPPPRRNNGEIEIE